jgi:Rod binding domain-containing protein
MISPIQSMPTVASPTKNERELAGRDAFRQFVGETVFGQMLSSMRKTVDKPAYFHGGRAEEVMQGQLDQQLAEEVSKSSADRFADPMYELFMLQQRT